MARAMTKGPTEFTAPRWNGDPLGSETLVPGGAKLDAAQFTAQADVIVTVSAAGAAAAATSVPVAALSGPIPANTRLNFGSKGTVVTTAEAAAAAVAITVEPIPNALVLNDVATFDGSGVKSVLSGTAIGRTIAERDAGTGYGPAAAADDEIFLVAFDVFDAGGTTPGFFDDVELYRHQLIVYENYLPAFTSLAAGVKTAIRAAYQCSIAKE